MRNILAAGIRIIGFFYLLKLIDFLSSLLPALFESQFYDNNSFLRISVFIDFFIYIFKFVLIYFCLFKPDYLVKLIFRQKLSDTDTSSIIDLNKLIILGIFIFGLYEILDFMFYLSKLYELTKYNHLENFERIESIQKIIGLIFGITLIIIVNSKVKKIK